MNQEFWQLRVASRNYLDAHRAVTKLSNRLKAVARAGLADPLLNEQLVYQQKARKQIGTELTRLYEQLAPAAIVKFQKETPGLGELYMAQLIGSVGDFKTYTEAWWETTDAASETSDSQTDSDQDEDSREHFDKRVLVTGAVLTCGVRDIWSYCGHGDASRKRRKGQTQEQAFQAGSPLAKTIVHMMADFALRFNGQPDKNGKSRAMCPYYPKYIQWKAEAADAHPKWNKGHCHNHAIRKVGKAILKDIWRVQHDENPVYGGPTLWAPRSQVGFDSHPVLATAGF